MKEWIKKERKRKRQRNKVGERERKEETVTETGIWRLRKEDIDKVTTKAEKEKYKKIE